MSIKYYDWAKFQANTRPNKIAIRELDTNREFTYQDLEDRSSKLAEYLQKSGVKKGDRVGILSMNCSEFFELEFACAKIGAIELPLNWRLTKPELDYILNDSEPRVLIYDKPFEEMVKELQVDCNISEILQIDQLNQDNEYELALNDASGSYQKEEVTLDDNIMIMYTSGTTGNPKGAMITHQMQLFNVINLGISAAVTPEAIHLVVLPLFHTGGMNCYSNPILHSGGELILVREFEPGRVLSIIGNPEYGITHLFAVPAPYQFMMNHPDFNTTDLSRVKYAGVGGAPCAEAILKSYIGRGVSMQQGWGMTETSPGATGLESSEAERKIGSAGKPLLHTEIKIVGEDGEELPHSEVGEIYIKGPNITPGYWRKEEATRESFIDGWLKTGDAAYFDDEGFLYIVDRWKDMYISGGENVYPAEVENVIYQLPQIAEVGVIGVDSEKWGETGKAYIALKPDQKITAEEVIDHCLKNLAKYKIPESVEFIEALPRNATGKVLKRTLRDM
tara:strand:- start:154 stop:1668 length:1515 start_codon:yes stop_codon:yes gene_type:complete